VIKLGGIRHGLNCRGEFRTDRRESSAEDPKNVLSCGFTLNIGYEPLHERRFEQHGFTSGPTRPATNANAQCFHAREAENGIAMMLHQPLAAAIVAELHEDESRLGYEGN
jgi:hypothetical protein